jgi:hypothetical protein
MDDTRPARAAEQGDPGSNPQFDRGWAFEGATGPDVPAAPAHSYTWHPEVSQRRQDALRRNGRAWGAAEAQWERLTGGDRASGMHQRGDRE